MDPTPPSAVVTPRFSVTIDSRLELVAVVADLTRIACASIGLAEIDDVEIAVVEAVSNVITHAYGGEPGHPVHVRFASNASWLRVDVQDYGKKLDEARLAGARMPVANDVCDLPERGYGLALIQQVMHEIGYQSAGGQNTLSMMRSVESSVALARCV